MSNPVGQSELSYIDGKLRSVSTVENGMRAYQEYDNGKLESSTLHGDFPLNPLHTVKFQKAKGGNSYTSTLFFETPSGKAKQIKLACEEVLPGVMSGVADKKDQTAILEAIKDGSFLGKLSDLKPFMMELEDNCITVPVFVNSQIFEKKLSDLKLSSPDFKGVKALVRKEKLKAARVPAAIGAGVGLTLGLAGWGISKVLHKPKTPNA
jgi:hypothetical protein